MYNTILVPVDLEDKHSWRKAVPTAVTLCEQFDAGLVVMTVVPDLSMPVIGQFCPPGFEQKVQQHAAGRLKAFASEQIPPGIEVRRVVAAGTIYQEIIHVAAKIAADLIIMGSHHPDLKEYHLGPNAARVVRHARGSVMVVRD
jgi:nucleotide-binding universal stress UspA family protein